MTSLINLVDDEEKKTTMSTEELQCLLEDIAKKVEQPDSALKLLKMIE